VKIAPSKGIFSFRMKNEDSASPTEGSYQGYELAYKLAVEQLTRIDDIEQQCRQSGARYVEIDSQPVIILEYLNQSYQVTLPQADITLVDSQEEVPIRDKVLILHYLTLARGTPTCQ